VSEVADQGGTIADTFENPTLDPAWHVTQLLNEASLCQDFVHFRSFGGPNPGTQGGVLELVVTLLPDGGAAVTGVPMSVTCRVNAPAGFTEEEGITLGFFTEKVRGATLFHLNQ
jgi:hypothetical protein